MTSNTSKPILLTWASLTTIPDMSTLLGMHFEMTFKPSWCLTMQACQEMVDQREVDEVVDITGTNLCAKNQKQWRNNVKWKLPELDLFSRINLFLLPVNFININANPCGSYICHTFKFHSRKLKVKPQIGNVFRQTFGSFIRFFFLLNFFDADDLPNIVKSQ